MAAIDRALAPPLRVLAVQTTQELGSEVRVLLTVLEGLAATASPPPVEVLLLQGADHWSQRRLPEARVVTTAFRRLPYVTVRELNIGRLGRQDVAPLYRALKGRDLLALPLVRAQMRRIGERFRPHLVYSAQQQWDLRLAAPLAQTLGCPEVVHLHYTVGPALGRGVVQQLRQAAMVVCVSGFIRDQAIAHGVSPQRARVLYNSMDCPPALSAAAREEARREVRAALRLPAEATLIGMFARLNPSKGQDELLRALLPLLLQDRLLHLLIAGSEDPANNGMSERLTAVAQAGGVGAQLHLLGFRRDVPRLLDGLDLFAHPSHAEPFTLAILEAAAHGLPVVAWHEGGTAEMVVDGQTGLLAPSGEIVALTAALSRLLSDPDLRHTMGAQARTRIQTHFLPQQAAQQFAALLHTVVRDHSGQEVRQP